MNASAAGAGGAMSLNTVGPKENVYRLINNTFFANEGALGADIGNWTDSTGVSTLILQNNIFSGSFNDSYAIEDGFPVIVSTGGNLSDDASLMPFANAMNDTHNEFPSFSAPGFGEFNLRDDSPAIDSGINDGAPELDILGNSRVGDVDKGAYEFGVMTAVEDLTTSLAQLSIYPVPADELVQYNLDNDWNGTVQLIVRNVLGQVIHQEKINKAESVLQGTVQISHLEKGSYLLNLRNETHSVTRTFIKQ